MINFGMRNSCYLRFFQEACKKANQPVNLRIQEGYDHSYFFISSFKESRFLGI
eukprot:TRINITY_DN4543_c0_g1_i1.p4 TRINITY_DN4543_c0_g1~~TRINITY_DN4543_c0_g1_i1.p4  ORF type:complete len:53 (+),score=6.20 TRINITY_DN4543_c0_g1_i1:585-743(+)